MATPKRLTAEALAGELQKLPALKVASSTHLDPIHVALARAVASGQDAGQLAQQLGAPVSTTDEASAASVATAKAETAAATTPPDWISEVVPVALARDVSVRVAVLDREPTALGGLELPDWARALSPSAIYGPVAVAASGAQPANPKWIIIFNLSETVEIVRNGTVLCVVPVSILHIGTPTQSAILAGSVWLAVNPFATTAPAGSFAGITVSSGQIVCDQPLTYNGTTVTIPATANLNLTLVPTPAPAGSSSFSESATPPGQISVSYPATGTPAISFDHCSALLYGESYNSTTSDQPALYDADLKFFYIQGSSTVTHTQPATNPGKLLTLTKNSPILLAGWSLPVSASTTPDTLGTATGPGAYTIAFGKGIVCSWPGCPRPETIASGIVLVQNNSMLLSLTSGAAPGTKSTQRFNLWEDQDADHRRCQILATRSAGQTLLYGLTPTTEILELSAALEARVDRPLQASGARFPASFTQGVVALIKNNAGNQLLITSSTPSQPVSVTGAASIYPLALDNAFLEVTPPQSLLLIGTQTDESFNVRAGRLQLLFNFLLVELYLPDPYTGNVTPASVLRGAPTTNLPPTATVSSGSTGSLAAAITWAAPNSATLRLSDTAHTQPTAPPTTEAGSTVQPTPKFKLPKPILTDPLPVIFQPVATTTTAPAPPAPITAPPTLVAKPAAAAPPKPNPLPTPPAGTTLIDLSTRASQLGVEVITNERYATLYTIDGLSVRGPADLLPLTTLPAIAWEPMYNTAPADPSVLNDTLLHPPNDGPLTQIRANSATLIPISPLQSLQAVLNAGGSNIEGNLTLPFGMVGQLSSVAEDGTILPTLALVQPVFPATATPTGEIYTGAWQLSIAAPDPDQADPVLAGRTYLRMPEDATNPGYSYGEQVLSADVADIFSSRFNGTGTGVPLRRYDLTGYGASTFSEWTNTHPVPTDVVKAFFHVLIGRSSHEVIQVQSLIYPWAIKVVRTITIDRLASGTVQRYDSGWQAASDGLFDYPDGTGITPDQIHSGPIGGVINVKNIQVVGLPVSANATEDFTGYPPPATPVNPGDPAVNPTPSTKTIAVQAVTFDADVIIPDNNQVQKGSASASDLTGETHVCVPSKGITGYIGLEYKYHLSLSDMAAFAPLAGGSGGPINATINVNKASHLLRATEFNAVPVNDTTVSKLGIACALLGLPKLSKDGSWSMAVRKQGQDAPTAIPATQAVPIVQPNQSGTDTLGSLAHYADPSDIFRLASDLADVYNQPNLPQSLYGFLQATGTQSNLLSHPILSLGSSTLTLGDALNVAHAGALLGALGDFPGISQCLQFLGSEFTELTNELSDLSLQLNNKTINIPLSVRQNPVPLITTSIADVNLYFHWKDDTVGDSPGDSPAANVVISLGQPTDPSWSLDINRVGVGLIIPALNSSKPVLWLQGGLHADADSLPSFPGLKVLFDDPLSVLATFFTVLEDIASVLSPGSSSTEIVTAHDDGDDDDDSDGLHVHFSGGKLAITDTFNLGSIPLGPGTIDDVSLEIGATVNILAKSIDFLVGIGKPDAPCHWIVDPLSGTICLQAGVQSNQLAVLIQGGIGLGLSIDLGIASGSASITIAVQVKITGSVITLTLLLTGQAQVDVLGGLASAAITLTAGLGFTVDLADGDIGLLGTASVGIHISICWVINISWSGSWTFQKQLALTA